MATRRRRPYPDKANNAWVASMTIGYNDQGKPIRKKTYHANFEDALAALEAMEVQARDGLIVAKSSVEKPTLGEWVNRWFAHASGALHPNTSELYRGLIKNHIETSSSSRVVMQKITPLHIEQVLVEMERKKVGRRPQQLVHVILRQAMARAVKLELLTRSPAERVERPRIDRAKRRQKLVWTAEDARAFLAAASAHELSALWALALATAMRQSEILGLLWEHVHLSRGTLDVRLALHEVPKKWQEEHDAFDERCPRGLILTATKTATSERTVVLPRVAHQALVTRAAQRPTGGKWDHFVFTWRGQPIRASSFRKVWKSVLTKAGVPVLPFKQLRHTCLTLLAEADVPLRAAQALAGHSSSQITADVYQQATARLSRVTADAIDRVLLPNGGDVDD